MDKSEIEWAMQQTVAPASVQNSISFILLYHFDHLYALLLPDQVHPTVSP
jgi:hypothetical protein